MVRHNHKSEIWQSFKQQQQQVMINRGTIYPVKTIIGKDLDVRGSLNADITSNPLGIVPAGRLMLWTAVDAGTGVPSGVLTPWSGTPISAVAAELIVGVLAQDTDTNLWPPSNHRPACMVWRMGTFLAQEIEEANRVGDAVNGIRNQPFLEVLRKKGIIFEWSWEGYGLIENPPAGPPTIP